MSLLTSDNPFKIEEHRVRQTTVAFRVAVQQEDLEADGGFVQDGDDVGEATGVGVGEYVVQDDALPFNAVFEGPWLFVFRSKVLRRYNQGDRWRRSNMARNVRLTRFLLDSRARNR